MVLSSPEKDGRKLRRPQALQEERMANISDSRARRLNRREPISARTRRSAASTSVPLYEPSQSTGDSYLGSSDNPNDIPEFNMAQDATQSEFVCPEYPSPYEYQPPPSSYQQHDSTPSPYQQHFATPQPYQQTGREDIMGPSTSNAHLESMSHDTTAPTAGLGSSENGFPDDIVDQATGRPKSGDLLLGYDTHRAKLIWEDPSTAVVCRVRRRDAGVRELLAIYRDTPPHAPWRKLVDASGFARMFSVNLTNVDHNIIYAFVERWHPETNTFHLPFGEMTIALHDVEMILGLPIDGDDVSEFSSGNDLRAYATELFGEWDDDEWHQSLHRGGFATAELKKRMLAMMEAGGSPESIASAWLLQLLGLTVFMDKSGNKVKVQYLDLVRDHNMTGRIAWGALTLAYLYRQLGEATRTETQQIAGFNVLLGHWISLHFPCFQARVTTAPLGDKEPLGAHFREDRTPSISPRRLIEYREQIERLDATQVIWSPHRLDKVVPLSMYRGTIRFGRIIEPYHPDRVARQFGRVQDIPCEPIRPTAGQRSARGRHYFLNFDQAEHRWATRHSTEAICSTLRDAPFVLAPWQDTNKYIYWYVKHCHPYILKSSWTHKGPKGEPSFAVRRTQSHFQIGTRLIEMLARGTPPTNAEIQTLLDIYRGDVSPPVATQPWRRN